MKNFARNVSELLKDISCPWLATCAKHGQSWRRLSARGMPAILTHLVWKRRRHESITIGCVSLGSGVFAGCGTRGTFMADESRLCGSMQLPFALTMLFHVQPRPEACRTLICHVELGYHCTYGR